MYVKVWDDKYVIKSDAYCYILAEIKTKAKQEDDEDAVQNEDGTYEVNIAYTNSFAGCYRTIIEREGRKNKCTTLDGYIKHLEKIYNKLEEDLDKMAKIVGGKEQLELALNKLP